MNDGLLRGLSAVMKGKHRHDETWRAEAALGGVGVDHRPLHGMKLSGRCGQTLDGQDGTMVDLRQHHQTGVDGLVVQISFTQPAENDGACAAISLGAAFLGAGEACTLAQKVEHRHRGRRIALGPPLPVQQEMQMRHFRVLNSLAVLLSGSPHERSDMRVHCSPDIASLIRAT